MDFQRQAEPSNRIVARSLLDKGVLQPHSLAKYAAAFFKMSRSSVTRLSSARLGRKCADDDIVSLIGTRFDESVQRERKMSERGESAFEVVILAADAGGYDWVLSPITEMTTMDVFS